MEFLDFEAIDEDLGLHNDDNANAENDDDGNVNDNFIDTTGLIMNYYWFDNVTKSADEALNGMLLFDYEYQEANNYCREDFNITNEKIDEFQDSKKKAMILKKHCLLLIIYHQRILFIIQFVLQFDIYFLTRKVNVTIKG